MLTHSGPKVIEFNCRFGDPECQALMPLMGPQFATVLQSCALGCLSKAPNMLIANECSVCVVAAASGYPEAPLTGSVIHTKLESSNSVQVFHAGTSINNKGEKCVSGGRVLSVVAQAKDFDKAFENAYKSMDKIHFDGITFRSDIGHQVRKSER